MRDASSQYRDQGQRRKFGKRGRKKGRGGPNAGGNANRAAAGEGNLPNGNVWSDPQAAGPGVCIKCGHPAPDGKLCSFHRSLLNSLRNDFGKKGGRNYATI